MDSHRAGVHALCYRMLGSPHDAEDASQEAFLRAWRAMPCFEGRSTVRTWLRRIATNVCLNEIARRPKRALPVGYGPPPSAGGTSLTEGLYATLWTGPYPEGIVDDAAGPEERYERREILELTLVAALQYLPARQRAVFVLRDVLDFPAAEAAQMLSTSQASVNSALQRAREAISARLGRLNRHEELPLLGDQRLREFATRLVGAFERGDVGAIVALLAEEGPSSAPTQSDRAAPG